MASAFCRRRFRHRAARLGTAAASSGAKESDAAPGSSAVGCARTMLAPPRHSATPPRSKAPRRAARQMHPWLARFMNEENADQANEAVYFASHSHGQVLRKFCGPMRSRGSFF